MDINKRLADLRVRKLIDEGMIEIVLSVQKRLAGYWQADVGTRQVSMLLFHLACALGRIRRGSHISPLYQEFLDEIESAVDFSMILTIHQDLLQLIPFSVPKNEQTYLPANIYSLILDQPKIMHKSYATAMISVEMIKED